MITKTVTIDEFDMYDRLSSSLEDRYELCGIDYRDEIPTALVQQCLDKRSRDPLDVEDLWWESREYDTCVR